MTNVELSSIEEYFLKLSNNYMTEGIVCYIVGGVLLVASIGLFIFQFGILDPILKKLLS